MNITNELRQHSPSILAGLGIASFVGAVMLTAKVAPKAEKALESTEEESTYEKAKIVAPIYAPVVGMMLLGTGCLVASNRIQSYRYASVVALWTIGERNFEKYKQSVMDEFGAKKAEKAYERYAEPEGDIPQAVVGDMDGQMLFHDHHTQRYFRALSVETVRAAINDVNELVLNEGWACLNEYYYHVGLEPVPFGSEIGWGSDHILAADFVPFLKDSGTVISVVFKVEPRPFNSHG